MVVGCGAWITALCIIGALAALLANAGGVGLLALSVLLALAAAGLRQLTAHPVARQVGATLVLSAYGVGLFGVGDLIRSGTPMQLLPVLTAFSWAFLGAAVLGYPSPQIHTVLGLGSLGFTAAWLHAIDRLLPHLLLVVALWVAIALQLHRGGQQIGALARILAVAWLAVHLLVVALDARDTGRAVFDAVACSIALVWVLVYLQRAYGWSKHWPVIVAGEAVAALTLGIVLHPGVVAGVMLLVIGLSFNDRSLSVGGGVLLAATLIQAYYSLHLTLLTKSLALMAAGVVLLGARGLLPAAPAGSRSRLPTMEVQT